MAPVRVAVRVLVVVPVLVVMVPALVWLVLGLVRLR